MTVVLFCGGLGMRMRELSRKLPKPMVRIGEEPILCHLMRYYAHYGHRDFVLCLGYLGEAITEYFLQLADGGAVETLSDGALRVQTAEDSTRARWTVTLLPTGHDVVVGDRLRLARRHVRGEIFLANYTDGLSDLHLPTFLTRFAASGALAGLISVRPSSSMHIVTLGKDGFLSEVRPAAKSEIRVNGGFFAFRREIFDRLLPGEDLLDGLFPRLGQMHEIVGYAHDGFWGCMDTAKDWHELETIDAGGEAPWKVWARRDPASGRGAPAPHPVDEAARRLLGIQDEVG